MHEHFLRFMQELIYLRRRHPCLKRRQFFRGKGPHGDLMPDIVWHGVRPHDADFSGSTLAFTLDTVAPAVTVNSPPPGKLTNTNLTIAGQLQDATSGPATQGRTIAGLDGPGCASDHAPIVARFE